MFSFFFVSTASLESVLTSIDEAMTFKFPAENAPNYQVGIENHRMDIYTMKGSSVLSGCQTFPAADYLSESSNVSFALLFIDLSIIILKKCI